MTRPQRRIALLALLTIAILAALLLDGEHTNLLRHFVRSLFRSLF